VLNNEKIKEVFTMSNERRHFTREFKLRAVKMVENRGDRTIVSIAEELGIHENLLMSWRKKISEKTEQAFLNKDPLLNELERLRKENADLKIDQEILKKALAIFSRQGKK
jgi:transposase